MSGAPTPAGTSVFTKHNWDMGMGYLWLNGWSIYGLLGWTFMTYCYMKPYKIKGSECQYMIYCTANISHIALWLLTRRATANTISPPPYCMYSVLKEPGTIAKASHKFSWLFVQLHSAYLVC